MAELIRAKEPSISSHGNAPKMEEINPEMAQAAMIRDLLQKLPVPAIDSKKFTVFYGMMKSINHEEGNQTFIDTSLLCRLFHEIEHNSVNENGSLFNAIWAYANHPTMVLTGMPQMAKEEEKQGLIARGINWIRGGDRQTTEKKS